MPKKRRPKTVPAAATWNADIERWELATTVRGSDAGELRVWSDDGSLYIRAELRNMALNGRSTVHDPSGTVREEYVYVDGVLHGACRLFDEDGNLTEAGELSDGLRTGDWSRYAANGKLLAREAYDAGNLHGACVYRGVVAREFAVKGVAEVRGQFAQGLAHGRWVFIDRRGDVVARRNLGKADDRSNTFFALANVELDSAKLKQRAIAFRRLGNVGEALCAAARFAAKAGHVKPLKRILDSATLPVTPALAERLASELDTDTCELYELVNVLLRGGEPVTLLRDLAVRLDGVGSSVTARDLLDAALLLAPERIAYRFNRGIVYIGLGLPELVDEEVDALRDREPLLANMLAHYRRALFSGFVRWPPNEEISTRYNDLPSAPAQSLRAVKRTIAKYARRLCATRSAMLKLAPRGSTWLPPNLRNLAVGARLERVTFTDAEGSEVDIDESVDAAKWSLGDLLRTARCDWSALTWLCWSVGLDKVGMPRRIVAPRTFGIACGMADERLWRARDKAFVGGASAAAHGIPGFDYEGVAIDTTTEFVARLAAQEYAEIAAMFRWLADDAHRSPWQDNLRGS